MKKAFTSILETCLRTLLVPETCRAYLRRLVGQLIPSNLQKLQVQGAGPPVSSRRERPSPRVRGLGGTRLPPTAVQEEQCVSRQGWLPVCLQPVRSPPAAHRKPAAAGGETTVFGQELPPGPVLAQAWRLYPAFALPAVRCGGEGRGGEGRGYLLDQ